MGRLALLGTSNPLLAVRKSKGYALQSNYGLLPHGSLEPSLIHLVANTIKRSLIQLGLKNFIHRWFGNFRHMILSEIYTIGPGWEYACEYLNVSFHANFCSGVSEREGVFRSYRFLNKNYHYFITIEDDFGPNMLKEYLTTVSRRSFCITILEGTEAGADQRKDRRKAETPKAETNWMNRHMCLFKRLRRRRGRRRRRRRRGILY